jgi:flagellar basal body-associated protein FliL
VKKQMRKRVITLLFLPIAIFLWIIGWTMLWTGSHKQQQTQQTQAKTTSEDDFITITAMIPEEPEECET